MEALGLGIILSFHDNASTGLARILFMFNSLKKSIADLSRDMSSLSFDGIIKATTALGAALTTLGVLASSVFKDMIQDTIKLGITYEKYLVGLEQLWGSKDMAKKKFEEYESIAAQTPFTFEEIMPQAIRAKALGIDPSEKLEVEVNGKKYSRSFFDAMMDLYTIRPDKGKESAGRGIVEYVEGQARPLKWMYGFNDKHMLESIGEAPKADHKERLKDVIKMEAMRNMIGAWEKTEQMFSVVLDNIIGDLHYLAYFINQAGFFEQIKAPFLDFYKFLKSITQEEDKHTMKALGESIANAFGIISAPAMGAINALFGFLKVLINFSAQNPKITTTVLAIAGLASQLVLLGGVLLLASAAFNFFRARVMRGATAVTFMRRLFLSGVYSLGMFARAVFPVVFALGTLYYAFRQNMFGIRSILSSTADYISNFFTILADALTHNDIENHRFSLSRRNYNLAQEMGIYDLITGIVTVEGYVIRFFKGFSNGVKETQEEMDKLSKSITFFMHQLGLVKFEKSEGSIADFRMIQEGRQPTGKSIPENGTEGTYTNPIKNNVIYNKIVDLKVEDVGTTLGNIVLPLALVVGGMKAFNVVAGVLTTVVKGLGVAFRILHFALIPLKSAFSGLLSPLRGVLQSIGGFIISVFSRIGTLLSGIVARIISVFKNPTLIATGIQSLLNGIGTALLSGYNKLIGMFGSIGNIIWTVIAGVFNRIRGYLTRLRIVFGLSGGGIQGFYSVLSTVFSGIASRIPIFGRFISYIFRTGNAIRGLRFAFLALSTVMAANPIGFALLAIGLAVGFIINHWEQFQNTASDVWNHITQTLEQAWQTIQKSFEPAIKMMKELWKEFSDSFPDAAQTILGALAWIDEAFTMSDANAQAVFNGLGTVIKIAFDIIVAVATSGIAIISGGFQILVGAIKFLAGIFLIFTGDWEGGWALMQSAAETFGNGVMTIIYGIRAALIDLKNGFLESIGVIDAATAKMEHYQAISAIAVHTNPTVSMQTSSNYNPGGAYATGGIITRPEIALIGEAGREIIVPVTRRDNKTKNLAYLAAKETGILADIVNEAQINNNPIGFEVRGMQPISTSSINTSSGAITSNNNSMSTAYSNLTGDVNTSNALSNFLSNTYLTQQGSNLPAEINTTFSPIIQSSNYEGRQRNLEFLKPEVITISSGIQRLVNDSRISRNYYETRQNIDRYVSNRELVTLNNSELAREQSNNFYNQNSTLQRYLTNLNSTTSKVVNNALDTANSTNVSGTNNNNEVSNLNVEGNTDSSLITSNNTSSIISNSSEEINSPSTITSIGYSTNSNSVGELNPLDTSTDSSVISNTIGDINSQKTSINYPTSLNNLKEVNSQKTSINSIAIQEALNSPYITSMSRILEEPNDRRYYSPLSDKYELRGESKWQKRQVTGLDALTTAINEGGLQGLINLYLSKGKSSYPRIQPVNIISTSRSNTPLPDTNVPMMSSLSGIPSEDRVFLEQMFSNPFNPPRPTAKTSKEVTVTPAISSTTNEVAEAPVISTEESKIIEPTTIIEENNINKPSIVDRAVTGWKALQRNVGNFFGGIFGFRKPKNEVIEENIESEIPLPVISEINREETSNSVIAPPQQEKKKGGIIEGFVSGWKALQRNVGNFLGGIFGFREHTDEKSIENTETISSLITDKNKEITSNNLLLQQNTESVEKPIQNMGLITKSNLTRITRPIENLGLNTLNNESIIEEMPSSNTIRRESNRDILRRNAGEIELRPDTVKTSINSNSIVERNNSVTNTGVEKTSSNVINSLIETRQEDIFGGIIGKVKKTLQSINNFLTFEDSTDIESTTTDNRGAVMAQGKIQPIQPITSRTGLPISMPVQTFSQSVQLPAQQTTGSTAMASGGERNISYHIDAIKLEIKSEVDVKKIVPLIKKELQRLQTTNQKGGF